MLASKVDELFQKVDLLQPTPSHTTTLVGGWGKLFCVKCVEFNDIAGMSPNSVVMPHQGRVHALPP